MVPAASPVALELVTFAPRLVVVSPAVNELFVARSTTKLVSFVLLSLHDKLIWVVETAVALRLLGAAGAATGYTGPVCIEVEDRAYEASLADRQRALRQSRKFLEQFVG